MILDTIAQSKFAYSAGASGTVTVTAGPVVRVMAYATAGGATLTITPGGPGQSNVAGDAIPIPANGAWFELPMLGQLGPGSVFAFAGTAAYFVEYARS